MMTETERAYFAGLFDGEGSITSYQHSKNGFIHPTLNIAQKDNTILRELSNILGYGAVYKNLFKITNKKDIRRFIKEIYPYSRIKKEQLKKGYLLAGLIGTKKSKPTRENLARRFVLHKELKLLKIVDD